ncbi:hypothetical protein B0I35DRAFT_454657 [Stachybotrys elegans]|uniref:NACHT domain-containing protein n=1 Tax=Stachybotrys elegans TaxID=80388 RepID=A0A8K0SCS3_9HYPO|nr:hypothetical protein B0I35DRAFT_454657 [Stachybotrys elegans]
MSFDGKHFFFVVQSTVDLRRRRDPQTSYQNPPFSHDGFSGRFYPGKVKTNSILGESGIPNHISQIVAKDASIFARPGPEEDVLYDANYDHPPQDNSSGVCQHCDASRLLQRPLRATQNPKVHYGLVASGNQVMRHGRTRDKLAEEHGILCFEMEAASLMDITQCLIICGICDYADSHKSKRWQGYAAAAAAAAYAKEILSLTLNITKPVSTVSITDDSVAAILDALLLTRPELMIDLTSNVLLYYFCSNCDKNRNSALTIMRGILYQWISQNPKLVIYIRSYFEGVEITKYTITSFICLWGLFLVLLRHWAAPRVFLVLDGLDECEEESLQHLLDVLGDYLLDPDQKRIKSLKMGLRQFRRIRLDDSDIGQDVVKYISAKVAELASEQILPLERLEQIHKTLLASADGTFLWVGFVANELKGKRWLKAREILCGIPKGLGGIYCRLLEQVEEKEKLVSILQWVLALAVGIEVMDTLLLSEIEDNVVNLSDISTASLHNTLLTYASLYWPEHFRHARFFQHDSAEKAGGAPPSFSLLHLAAYFGNLAWAKMLLQQGASDGISLRRNVSKKDSYGRTPLFWAATRGHRDVVELLLDHGANINCKDRGKMTALHIAVTGGHKDVVTLLLDRSARLEDKAYYGDTPLMRAIQAHSKDLVQLLLERGARVDELPRPTGGTLLKGPKEPLHASLGRWEVLQDLVKNNETARLRQWAQSWIKFGKSLIETKNAKSLEAMTGLSVRVFQVVSSADLEALLVIGVLVGSGVMLLSAQSLWRDGVEISGRTFSQFASLAYQQGAEESLHYGVRQFLVDFDECLSGDRKAESVARVVVLFSTHLAVLESQDPWPMQYFSSVIREYFEGHIGGCYEEALFNAANEACASELNSISSRHDSKRLSLVFAALFQIAESSRDRDSVDGAEGMLAKILK